MYDKLNNYFGDTIMKNACYKYGITKKAGLKEDFTKFFK
jgi:hypothetical protein